MRQCTAAAGGKHAKRHNAPPKSREAESWHPEQNKDVVSVGGKKAFELQSNHNPITMDVQMAWKNGRAEGRILQEEKLLIIDGCNLLFQMFYGDRKSVV